MEKKYYILSLKYSDSQCVWWRPDCAGYTRELTEAGPYTEEEVSSKGKYFDNGASTKAILIEEANKHAKTLTFVNAGVFIKNA